MHNDDVRVRGDGFGQRTTGDAHEVDAVPVVVTRDAVAKIESCLHE